MVRYEKIRRDITRYHKICPVRETRFTIILDLYFSDQLFAYALGNDKDNNKENNNDNDKDQCLHALHTCFMSLIGRQRSDKSCQRGGSINCSPQRLILTKRPEKKLEKNKSLLLVMEWSGAVPEIDVDLIFAANHLEREASNMDLDEHRSFKPKKNNGLFDRLTFLVLRLLVGQVTLIWMKTTDS